MTNHRDPALLHVAHHGPGPLDQLPSEQLFAVVHSDCDCYTTQERADAWAILQKRPDFDVIMWGRIRK
jgi:hypothetical protein